MKLYSHLKTKTLLVCSLFTLFILACGMTAPVSPTPAPTATPAPLPTAAVSFEVDSVLVADFYAYVTADVLNVRACGSRSCEVVAYLHEGDFVSGFCNDDWCWIGTGYIFRGCTSDPQGLGCE